MSEWIQSLARMAEGRATRSTAMQPLLWLVGIVSLLFAGSLSAPKDFTWVIVVAATGWGVVVVYAMVVFWKFSNKDPDLLRSEKFLIRRMEIEQSAIGDSVRGVLGPEELKSRALPKPIEDDGSP